MADAGRGKGSVPPSDKAASTKAGRRGPASTPIPSWLHPALPKSRRRRSASNGTRRVRKTLTITYWRLVDLRTGASLRSEAGTAVGWEQMLADLGNDAIHSGELFARTDKVSDRLRLILARDRDFAPRQRDASGRVSPMPLSADDNEVIEEAFVSFLPGYNVFAIARSSAAAPHATAVADFLMAQGILYTGLFIKAEPVIDNERFSRVQATSRQASWIDVTARPSQATEGDGVPSLVRRILGVAEDVGDNVRVEIRVTADDKTADATRVRERLFEDAVAVAANVGSEGSIIEGAAVKVVGEVGPIDLVNDRIVYQRSAAIELAGTNRSLSESEVFELIDSVTRMHWTRIRQCLGAPLPS